VGRQKAKPTSRELIGEHIIAEALVELSNTRSPKSIWLSTSLFWQKDDLKQSDRAFKLKVAAERHLAPIELNQFVGVYRCPLQN
jgi:hypothetical protein